MVDADQNVAWCFPCVEAQLSNLGVIFKKANFPPREEQGWLRHQEIFGEAHLSAADGVVAHTEVSSGANDHPVRSPDGPHRQGV